MTAPFPEPHSAPPGPHSAPPEPHSAPPEPHSAPPEPHSAPPEPHSPRPELVEGPDFSLQNHHGQTVSRADLLGSPALLVFYPYAFSGICSSELTELQNSLTDVTAAGARVLAISVDTIYALRTFGDQLGLEFDLLSDFWPHGAVAQRYGVFDEQRGCAIRGSFLLDAAGVVRWSVRHEIGQARDIGEALRTCISWAEMGSYGG